jgi:hypothetical protein
MLAKDWPYPIRYVSRSAHACRTETAGTACSDSVRLANYSPSISEDHDDWQAASTKKILLVNKSLTATLL